MKKILLTILLLSEIALVTAQGKWELRKNENGISVFSRKPASGNLQELHVTCELDATKAQLIKTLLDINGYDDWVYSNKNAAVLKTISPQKVIYYAQSQLPWPIKDRDMIIELTLNPTPDVLNIQAKGLPTFLPKRGNLIRVPYSLAIWKVTQGMNNKLKVDYTFNIDPGGGIPAWMVNATMATGSYNTFAKLKELLKAKYNKANQRR
jgi:hypothetical protein